MEFLHWGLATRTIIAVINEISRRSPLVEISTHQVDTIFSQAIKPDGCPFLFLNETTAWMVLHSKRQTAGVAIATIGIDWTLTAG